MFVNAGAMAMAGYGIGRGQRSFYYFAMALLVVNIVLTVTDQLGIFDILTLAVDLVLLGLLIAARSRYLKAK